MAFVLKHVKHNGKYYMLKTEKWYKANDLYEAIFEEEIRRQLPEDVPEFDYVKLSLKEKDTKWIAYFIKDNEIVRRYININTPIKIIEKNNDVIAEYKDLIIDVIIDKGKDPVFLDLDELKDVELTENEKNIIIKTLKEIGVYDAIKLKL